MEVYALAEHPLRQLYGAGALVTVNTDTPAIFGTTLSRELALLESAFGLGQRDVERIVGNAFAASFDASS